MEKREIQDILARLRAYMQKKRSPLTVNLYVRLAERLLSGELTGDKINTASRRAQVCSTVSWLRSAGVTEEFAFDIPDKNSVKRTNRRSVARQKSFSEQDLERFLATLPKTKKGKQLHLISRLSFYSGFRLFEALAIRPAKIKKEKTGWIYTIEHAKRDKERDVPLRKQEVQELLKSYPKGLTLKYSYARNIARIYMRKAGIDSSFHGLRHSCASFLLEKGVPSPAVRDILGHESLAITDIYAHSRGARSPEFKRLGY